MSGFHFSKVPKFKIRRGGVVEDISLPPLVPSAASGLRSTVLQVSEMTTDNFYILPVLEATSEVPSTSVPDFLQDPCSCLGALDNQGKGKQEPRAGRRHSGLPRPHLSASTNILTLGPAKTS
ncbi:hypothetical protein Fot_48709 [Forsythia ovata]|uniref:Uncharacterized protein n=1 Tax=Forsythia ovata TaxID=205694 RepID=A0ABD1QBH2_9LAMI